MVQRRKFKQTEEVPRFQCLFLNLQLVVAREESDHQELAPIPMDKQLLDGDWSTSEGVQSCNVSLMVSCFRPTLTWKKGFFEINGDDDDEMSALPIIKLLNLFA